MRTVIALCVSAGLCSLGLACGSTVDQQGGGSGGGGSGGTSAGGGGGGSSPTCTNCPGCCAGTSCVAFSQQDTTTCGANGSACSACGFGLKCETGGCVFDDTTMFKLTALEIANCSCTDAIGLPDPFVTLQSPSSSASTNTCSDVVGCKFSSGSIDVTAGDLVAGKVTFHVYDEDTSFDDDCGGGAIKLPSPIVPATYEVSVGGQTFTFKVDAK